VGTSIVFSLSYQSVFTQHIKLLILVFIENLTAQETHNNNNNNNNNIGLTKNILRVGQKAVLLQMCHKYAYS
jgi:hypothetical protein